MQEILDIEKALISASKSVNKSYEDIFEAYDGIIDSLSTRLIIAQLGKYHQQLHVLMKKHGRLATDEQKQEINAIANLALIQQNIHSPCFRAQMLTLEILNKIAIYNNDWESSYRHYRQMYQLYKKQDWLSPSPVKRVMMTHNYLYRCAFTERYDEMKQVLAEIKDFAADTIYDSSTFFECYYTPLLIYCRKTADFSQAHQLPEAIDRGINKFNIQLKIPFKLNMIGQVGVLLFIRENYSDALGWVNRLINHPQKRIFKKVLPSALVLRLLIYYELNAFRLLEYQIRNTQRSLQIIGLYPTFSSTFITFFKKMLNAPTRRAEQALFQQLYEDLDAIYPKENPAFGMFDFVDWAGSKAKQQTMKTFIRENLRKKRAKEVAV